METPIIVKKRSIVNQLVEAMYRLITVYILNIGEEDTTMIRRRTCIRKSKQRLSLQ